MHWNNSIYVYTYIHINCVNGYSFFNLRNFSFNLNSSNGSKLGKMLSLPKVCFSFKKIVLVIMELSMILLWLQKMVVILVESELDIWYYFICYLNLTLPFYLHLTRIDSSYPIIQLINKPLKSQQSGILNSNQNLHNL